MLSLNLNTPHVLKQATGDLYQITLLPFPHEIMNRNRGFNSRAHDVQEPLAQLGIFGYVEVQDATASPTDTHREALAVAYNRLVQLFRKR